MREIIAVSLLLLAVSACAIVEGIEQSGTQTFDRNDPVPAGPTPVPTPTPTGGVSGINQLVITDGPPDDNVIQSVGVTIGQPTTFKVIACSIPVGSGPCPVSAEVPTENLQVSFRVISNVAPNDPLQEVVQVKEISGRFVSLSGLQAGTAEATIRANGQARPLLVNVQ